MKVVGELRSLIAAIALAAWLPLLAAGETLRAGSELQDTAAARAAPVCSYSVVASFPHDEDAFTQGLTYVAGVLYEGTGLYNGESSLRRVTLQTGEVEQIYELPAAYFGEGITVRNGELIQLTYREYTGFVYTDNGATFTQTGSFSYSGEGWGLTFDGNRLIMSDGSNILRFWDPVTFAEVGSVAVLDGGVPIGLLNELESIRGEVFANIWYDDRIARINPASGQVIAFVDLTGIMGATPPGVLNGVAFDEDTGHLLVTGKNWPQLFEVEMVGCPALALFADSFESGDTAAWSDGVP
jgi:glutamine cyclotransferase